MSLLYNIIMRKEEKKYNASQEEMSNQGDFTSNNVVEPENTQDDNLAVNDDLEEESTNQQNDVSAEKLEELQKKYDELNNSHLRLHADFDNYRKRTVKEKAEIIRSGGDRVLSEIISLVDDFERALSAAHESSDRDAVMEGIDLIYSKFISFLQQNGVKEIEAIGQQFDADKFEAVTTIPAMEESQKGMVVDCILKGYMLNDKVLRFPKVIVGE